MRILGLDVGTSSVKAAVLDVAGCAPEGRIARVPYEVEAPTPEAAQVRAERLWAAVSAAAREAARDFDGIEALGLSCMTPALVVLDDADQPLAPIWTHLDRRSRPVARQVWADVGEEFLQATGNRPLPGGISALCWQQLHAEDPYLDRRVKHYLHVNGWLGLHLTGARAIDVANACYTGLFATFGDRRWSPRWCDYFRVRADWLPEVVDGKATIGTLRPAVAVELGVPAGIPVKLGTADTTSAMLAAGMKVGDLLHVVGTTQVLAALTRTPAPNARRLTRLLGVGADFVHISHNPVSGAALEWLHQLCFHDLTPHEFYYRAIPDAERRTTRVTLDPPFLGGDRLEIEAHRAAFRGLTLTADRIDLLTGVLEAMRRGHRQALADLGVGERFEHIYLTGGGAEVVHGLLPGYREASVVMFDEGSLRGVARLFQ
jgi:xylulokinase